MFGAHSPFHKGFERANISTVLCRDIDHGRVIKEQRKVDRLNQQSHPKLNQTQQQQSQILQTQ